MSTEVEVVGDLSWLNSFGSLDGAPKASVVDVTIAWVGDVDGIQFVVVWAKEKEMRADVARSAMATPKSSLALCVAADGEDDANCVGSCRR